MDFTGERYIPSVEGDIKYEHLHRYAICLDFVNGKSVLDIASGEGYGSALLANVAESVIGVDIDYDSVEYAKTQYHKHKNLKFIVGSCESIPLPNESVDVVTSFETIEHHDKHEEMMQEIKRVLKPGGIIIISSPNRLTYSDERNYSNPFHVKELYFEEFCSLLSQYFTFFKIYGQRLATSSFLCSLNQVDETSFKAYTGNYDLLSQKVCSLESPIYFIAICSDVSDNLNTSLNSLYIDESDDLMKAFEQTLHHVSAALSHSQSQVRHLETVVEHLQTQLVQKQTQIGQLQTTIDAAKKSKFWIWHQQWIKVKNKIIGKDS
jgi:ubiquinone/menaquinone biosynthesis C-methylase UbiE